MPENSARLGLPFIQPSQAQKHVTHNEAVQLLDSLVQLSVVSFDAETPPSAPVPGEIHALGASPTGDWAGQAGMLAIWEDTAWRFLTPGDGWRAWGQAEGVLKTWTGGAWGTVIDLQNLDGVGIGTGSDATNVLAVSGPATLLSHDGAGHQLKLNKAASGETASLLYQSDWTGHAEIGLCGDNHLNMKVSPDGSTWTEAMIVNSTTGTLSGSAVQAGNYDNDGGKLLRMTDFQGPFDLGSQRANVISGSLDDILDDGVNRFMCWNTAATEVPWNYGLGLQLKAWDKTGNQIVFRRGSTPAIAFRGTLNASLNFSDWMEVYHSHNAVGTVSATPGVGSAIIERDSNSNGDYVRFTDGTQICRHTLTLDAPSTATGSLFQGANATNWTFPAAFASGTKATVTASDTNIGNIWFTAFCASASSANIRALRATSSGGSPVIEACALGRWK